PHGPDIAKARLVIISDGDPSHENRALGVAEQLGHPDAEILQVRLRTGFWQYVLPYVAPFVPVAWWVENLPDVVREAGRCDVVMGSGALAGKMIATIKRQLPELFCVVLGQQFGGVVKVVDVLAAAQHEGVAKAANVVITLAHPSRVSRVRTQQEAERWAKRLAHVAGPQLRGPKVVVLLSGGKGGGPMQPAEVREVLEPVIKLVKKREGAVLLSASMRTGALAYELAQALLERAKIAHYAWAPGEATRRDNPYLAFLALADVVLVSATSPATVSDVATAGKPILLWGDFASVPRRLRPFYAALAKQWRLAWWNGTEEMLFNQRPPAAGMMDTAMIAGFVRARWGKR
ncbi:MAG: hypothetical protein EBR79_03470, partial [Proteobacteria bacterium]|nr:hypothetical protein [Pseudomonadota bacterium]